MIIPGLADRPGDLLLLHLHPGYRSRAGGGIDLVDVEQVRPFLGDVLGRIGVGQGLAPGNILDGEIFENVLLGRILDRLLLQAIQQLLKIIRMHVPQGFRGILGQEHIPR